MANSQAHNAVKDKQTNSEEPKVLPNLWTQGHSVCSQMLCYLFERQSLKKTKLTILETSFLLHEGQFCSRRCDQKQLFAKIFAEIIDRN